MTILAVGDPVWTVLIVGAFGMMNIFAAWWMKREDRRDAEEREERLAARTDAVALEAKKAAVKVAEVLVETKAETTVKLDDIKHKVNSALGTQLKRVMMLSRDKAEVTPTEKNIAEADADQLAYENHMKEQEPQSPMPVVIVQAEKDPVKVTVVDPVAGETVDAAKDKT